MNTSKPTYLFSINAHPDAIHVNSLDITLLKPSIDFSHYDYLIITSKQTSKALLQYNKEEYIELAALCVSKQSAKSFEALGGKVLKVGGGYGDDLAKEITKFSKTTKWLYLRAEVVASDFVKRAANEGYHIDERVLYKSECSKNILEVAVEDNAVLIFTSPSSLHCFLQTHTLLPSHRVIVIGKTTAKALPKNIEYYISQETTIQSCMELAKTL